MNKTTQGELIGWLKRYVDDVTTVMIENDVVSLYVNGKRIGLILHQRIGA